MNDTQLDNLPVTAPAPATDAWTNEFARLRARFPRAKDTILFCAHVLQQDPRIDLEDLKARAALHGLRVTGASRTAAQRLLSPTTAAPRAPRRRAEAAAVAVAVAAPSQPQRQLTPRPRDRRRDDTDAAIEAMIRAVVDRVRAEAESRELLLRRALAEALAIADAALR